MALEVANPEFPAPRKGQAEAEAADTGDFPHATAAVDAVNLAGLATRPEVAVTVKDQPFGMIEAVREYFEPVEGYGWSHRRNLSEVTVIKYLREALLSSEVADHCARVVVLCATRTPIAPALGETSA